jgi:hypothetical protein
MNIHSKDELRSALIYLGSNSSKAAVPLADHQQASNCMKMLMDFITAGEYPSLPAAEEPATGC